MAIIGTFTAENGSYTGTLNTLTLKTKVTIAPVEKIGEKAPDYRVFAGNSDIGAAWEQMSKDDKFYLSVKLDDPSFAAAINCRLIETGKGLALIWNR